MIYKNYFIFDPLSIFFFLIMAIVVAGVLIYNNSYIKTLSISRNSHIKYSLALTLFVLSMTGAVFSNHLGLSWVFVEGTTLASAYLIYFQKTKHSLEAAWKYVFICSIGISLAFVGIILLLTGATGIHSLFYNDLYANAHKIDPLWLKLSFLFILTGFGTKIGLAPVHTWLPDAHAEAPSPVSALLSATLLNSAFLVLLRYYKLMDFAGLSDYANTFLMIMGFLSVFVTAVFVFRINNYKRMLAYSSIENMGLATIGIAAGGAGVYAAMLQLIGHSLIKAAFFLTSGNILNLYETKTISKTSGIIKTDCKTGWLWTMCFVGIAGIPPSPLFLSKFLLLKELFIKGQLALAVSLLVLMLVILYGIGKIVIKMSFGERSEAENEVAPKPINVLMYAPQAIFLTLAAILGVYMPQFLNKLILLGCR